MSIKIEDNKVILTNMSKVNYNLLMSVLAGVKATITTNYNGDTYKVTIEVE